MNNLNGRSAITASASVTCWAVAMRNAQAEEAPATEVAEAVTASEDLMREHGVLNRLMLVYEDCRSWSWLCVLERRKSRNPANKVIAPPVATIKLPRSPLPTATPTVRKINRRAGRRCRKQQRRQRRYGRPYP